MKRDMDLIREILLKIEEDDQICMNHDNPDYLKHVEILDECGYIKANYTKYENNQKSFAPKARLLSEGHDFLDSIRHDTIFQKVKANLNDNGIKSASFELIDKLAKGYLDKKLGIK